MTDREKLNYLAGQVSGLKILLHALIEVHPAPELLQEVLVRKYQVALAATIPMPVTEAFLAGLQAEAGFVMSPLAKGI